MDIRYVPKFAIHNRQEIEANELSSCYYCLKTFPQTEIKEYTDYNKQGYPDTVLCPYCHVDAVLPGKVEEELLKKFNNYWF